MDQNLYPPVIKHGLLANPPHLVRWFSHLNPPVSSRMFQPCEDTWLGVYPVLSHDYPYKYYPILIPWYIQYIQFYMVETMVYIYMLTLGVY